MWTLLRPGTRVTRPAQLQSREQIFRALLGIRQLMEHSVWRDADPQQGAGLGVLLVPGFGFGDRSLALTSRWLTYRGSNAGWWRMPRRRAGKWCCWGRAADLPAGVPALSVYSRSDGVVPWQLCLDPSAECVEIASGHVAMTLEPDFYTVLAPRLAEWAMAGRGVAV